MEFLVSELERREPVEFETEIRPGAIDFGEEAEQGLKEANAQGIVEYPLNKIVV